MLIGDILILHYLFILTQKLISEKLLNIQSPVKPPAKMKLQDMYGLYISSRSNLL